MARRSNPKRLLRPIFDRTWHFSEVPPAAVNFRFREKSGPRRFQARRTMRATRRGRRHCTHQQPRQSRAGGRALRHRTDHREHRQSALQHIPRSSGVRSFRPVVADPRSACGPGRAWLMSDERGLSLSSASPLATSRCMGHNGQEAIFLPIRSASPNHEASAPTGFARMLIDVAN